MFQYLTKPSSGMVSEPISQSLRVFIVDSSGDLADSPDGHGCTQCSCPRRVQDDPFIGTGAKRWPIRTEPRKPFPRAIFGVPRTGLNSLCIPMFGF